MRTASLCILVGLLLALSVATGAVHLSFAQVWQGLLGEADGKIVTIVQEIRLPRALLALMVGASLGISGAAIQGYTRNALADPGLLGISSAAALGASAMLYTGWIGSIPYALPIGGMVGAAAAAVLLFFLMRGASSSLQLILAGIAVSSFASALLALALSAAPNPFALMELLYWTLGSLEGKSIAEVWLALPFMLAGWGMLFLLKRPLDALSLGEETAASLGVSLRRTQWLLMLGILFCVGASVAVAGAIGFVGLVVPNILRFFTQHAPGRLLTASWLGGAALVLGADVAVKLIPTSGMEMKLGVMTALLGVPFLLYLVRKA